MAERAHPEQFKYFKKVKIFGIIPFYKFSPYRSAFFWRYRIASKYCAKKNVLDVPCGMGWGTSLLENAKNIIAVDISEEAIEEANTRYNGFASFEVGDMGKLNFKDNTFDTIICLEGFEHVPEKIGDSFLSECARLLKKDGCLVLSSPYPIVGEHSGNPFHIKEYRPSEIRQKLFGNNFKVLDEKKRKVGKIVMTIFVATKA